MKCCPDPCGWEGFAASGGWGAWPEGGARERHMKFGSFRYAKYVRHGPPLHYDSGKLWTFMLLLSRCSSSGS